MKKWIVLILLGGVLLPSISPAIDLKQSKFTQVVNNVEVISAADKARHSAAVNDVFKMPDVLRTGPDSRAELVAPDNTITRVGANTIFSFDPANRTIDLQQGSILFHSPRGKGGGTIRTGSATALVIGTTIIVTSTPGGGFKLLDLEGQAEIRFLNGLHRTLEPGQMTFILPGGSASPIVVFRLDGQTKGSLLVNGFDTPLPSIGKIDAEIARQLIQLLNNQAQDTGLLVGNNATPDSVQVRMDLLNNEQSTKAFQSGASVVGNDHVSGLPVSYSPLDSTHVVNSSFTPPDMDSINQGLDFLGITTPASGFVGKNIDIDTANVDLSSFTGKSDFDFVASGDIKIWQSVNFTPVSEGPQELPPPVIIAPDTITLIAGGQMLIAPGSTLEADTGTFGLVADSFGTLNTDTGGVGQPNTLNGVTVINNVGDVDILSLQSLNVFNSSVYAGGSIDIESQSGTLNLGAEDDVIIDADGSVSLSAGQDFFFFGGETGYIDARNGGVDILAGNQVNISDGDITAGNGNLNIIAAGGIYISGGDLEAHSSGSISSEESSAGNVTIDGTGTVQIENGTYIYGDGNVDISSSGTISLATEGSSSGSGTIGIENSRIEADGCVGVTADGTVYFSGDEITADNGSVAISGGGNVSIYSSTITANNGYVDIESGGTLAVGNPDSIRLLDNGHDVVIHGDGSVTLNGADAVNINNAEIYGGYDGESFSGDSDVTITSTGGGVDVENSDIEAGGSVVLNANGDATVNNAYMDAHDGDVDITSGGNTAIYASTIDASGNVDITSGGTLIVGSQGSITALNDGYDVSISAGGNVRLTASGGGDVDVTDTSISAGGNVCITTEGTISLGGGDTVATGGNIDLENSSVTAGGSINVTANDGNATINGTTLTAGSDYQDIQPAGLIIELVSTDPVNITSSGGDITVSAADTADISYSTLDVKGNISIFGDSTISTLENDVTISGGGGSVSISGNDVSIYGSEILGNKVCISGSDISAIDGSVNITDGGGITISGGTVSFDSSSISANNLTIKSGSDISAENGDVNITDSGSLTISADGTAEISGSTINANNIKICDSTITTDNGNITIDNEGTASIPSPDDSDTFTVDTISVCGSEIIATSGSVDISANGDVTINYSPIGATSGIVPTGLSESSIGGTVSISSGGQLEITGNNGNNYNGDTYLGYDIGASSSICLRGENGVSISDTVITTLDGNSSDTVKIFSGGDIDFVDSVNVGSYGSVKLRASGDVDTYNSSISADGGDVTICAGGNVDLEYTDVSADGSVNVDACGSVTVYNTDLCMNDWNVNAGTYVDLGAEGNVHISGSTITAQGGDVDITQVGGNISICDSTVTASIGVTLTANGDVTISGGSGITAQDGDVGITSNDGGAITACGSDITASGNICISSEGTISLSLVSSVSQNGSIDLENSTLSARNSVYVNASGDVTINDSPISATVGNEPTGLALSSDKVSISSGGELSITGTDSAGISDNSFGYDIGADSKVCLFGANGVSISDALIKTLNGDLSDMVKISSDGNISIDASEIDSGGNVTVAGYNGGSVNVVDGSIINASGAVTLSADGDVSVSDASITANDGDVTISSGGAISLNAISTVGGGSVFINSGSTVDAENGDVNVTAVGGDVSICGSSVNASGSVTLTADDNISIFWSGITAEGGDIAITSNDGGQITMCGSDISASGNVCITSDGTISLTGNASISGGGNIDIECSTVSAGDSVYMNASGNVTLNNSQVYFGNGNDQVLSDGVPGVQSGVQPGDVDISTTGGNGRVIICANGEISLQDSVFHANEGNISISDYHTTSANGSVNIQTGGEIDLYGGSLSMSGVEVVGGSISISDSQITANGGDFNIGGNGRIFFNGVLQNSGYAAVAGDISISDSAIISSVGDVNINSGGTVTVLGVDGDCVISGNNVTLNADSDVDLYGADISARAGDLNITAGGVLNIADDVSCGSTVLSGGNVTLLGGNGVSLDWNSGSGATITANNGSVLIESGDGDVLAFGVSITASGCVNIYGDYGNVDLEGTTVTATVGNVDIEAGHFDPAGSETLTLNNDSITAGGSVTLSAPGNGNLNQDQGGITISGTSINADTGAGTISVNNASGLTTVDKGSSMQAFYITVNSPDGIMFDGSSGGTLSGNTLTLTSGNAGATDTTIVENEDLTAFSSVNIAGHTLYISDTTFAGGSSVNLGSSSGTLNINNGNIPFDINLVHDKYGSTDITDPSQFTSGYSTSAGLHNYQIP